MKLRLWAGFTSCPNHNLFKYVKLIIYVIFMDNFENVISRQIKNASNRESEQGDSKVYMCLSRLPDVKSWRTEP